MPTSRRPGRFRSLPIVILLSIYSSLLLPGAFVASRTPEEIWAFSIDEVLFMVKPMLEILSGHVPGFYTYGNFPTYFSGALFFPFLVVSRIFDVEVSVFHAMVLFRLASIVASLGCVYFVYRIALEFLPRNWALVCALLAATCGTLIQFTLTLHPDVFQAMSVCGAVWFLIHFDRSRKVRDLVVSAIFAGCATSSKYWGVFLIPVAAIVAFRCRGARGKRLGLYLLVHFAVFFALNSKFLTRFTQVRELFSSYVSQYQTLAAPSFGELLGRKAALFTSPLFFGSLFFLAYLAVLAWSARRWIRRRDLGERTWIIHASLISICLYFILFYNDVANLPDGERYLLSFMILLPVPVVVMLRELLISRRMRTLGLAASALLALSQILRVTGIPNEVIWLGQGDWSSSKESRSTIEILRSFYEKESQGVFLVRQWVLQNVKPGERVYFEDYMNLSETDPLLQGRAAKKTYKVNASTIESFKPNYVLTTHEEIARSIQGRPDFGLIAYLGRRPGGRVFVLQRR